MIENLLFGSGCFLLGVLITIFVVNRYILSRVIMNGITVSKGQDDEEEIHFIHIRKIDGRQADILIEDQNISPFDKDIIVDWIDATIKNGIYV